MPLSSIWHGSSRDAQQEPKGLIMAIANPCSFAWQLVGMCAPDMQSTCLEATVRVRSAQLTKADRAVADKTCS